MRSPIPKPDRPGLFSPAPLPVAALDDRARLACLRLIRSENVGPVTFRELVNHCGGAEAALAALPELARRGGRKRIRICPAAAAEAELEAARRAGASPVFTIEPGYPPLLASVDVPPPLLFVKGRIEILARPAVAIVGSRSCSAAGQAFARTLAADLGRAGFVVVSGLARGIDGAAHRASLATGTVAVLAGGIDVVYPPEHADLHREIGEAGVLVTEQPPGFQPRGQDFPRRNRLISGLAHGVVIVEAARRSGTITTARFAAEQGREVLAVPGHPLDPRAEGTNALLKDGATLVTSAADVVEALAHIARPAPGLGEAMNPAATAYDAGTVPPAAPPPLIGTSERERVVAALGPAPCGLDDLQRACGLDPRQLAVVLMELDLGGRLERQGHGLVALRPPPDEAA